MNDVKTPCAHCGRPLGPRTDRIPSGPVHPACGETYRLQNAGKGDYESSLPRHLR